MSGHRARTLRRWVARCRAAALAISGEPHPGRLVHRPPCSSQLAPPHRALMAECSTLGYPGGRRDPGAMHLRLTEMSSPERPLTPTGPRPVHP